MPINLPPCLPTNRLRCTDCKSFRPIIEFPFDHGFRRTTCIKCKTRRANRREVQAQRQQLRKEKQEVEEVFKRQRYNTNNEAAHACGMPKRCWNCGWMSCCCEQLQIVDPQLGEDAPQVEGPQEEDHL